MATTVMPYAAQVGSAAVNAAGFSGPMIIVTSAIVLAIKTVQVVQRESLPRRLAEILADARAEPVPDPDTMLEDDAGLQALMGALITHMY